MSAGVGLIVIAAIFAVGVVLFGTLMISLLPGAVFVRERVEAARARPLPEKVKDESASR